MAADARYRSGMGNQHDLLQAQLERTKLLREITMHHLEVAKTQAQIKQLVDRTQSSPDLEPADLTETTLPYTFDELVSAAQAQNPAIAALKSRLRKRICKLILRARISIRILICNTCGSARTPRNSAPTTCSVSVFAFLSIAAADSVRN